MDGKGVIVLYQHQTEEEKGLKQTIEYNKMGCRVVVKG
jgi:hypothetical protein